jgi:hypothetical protein
MVKIKNKHGSIFSLLGLFVSFGALVVSIYIQQTIDGKQELERNCISEIKYFDIKSPNSKFQKCYLSVADVFKNSYYYNSFYKGEISNNLPHLEMELLKEYKGNLYQLISFLIAEDYLINYLDKENDIQIKNQIQKYFQYKFDSFNLVTKTFLSRLDSTEIYTSKKRIEDQIIIAKESSKSLNDSLKSLKISLKNAFILNDLPIVQFSDSSILFYEAASAYIQGLRNISIDETSDIILKPMLERKKELVFHSSILIGKMKSLVDKLVESDELDKFYSHNNELNYLFVNMLPDGKTPDSDINISPILYETTNRVFYKINKNENFTFHKYYDAPLYFFIPKQLYEGIENSPNKKNVALFYNSKQKLVFDFGNRRSINDNYSLETTVTKLEFQLFYLNMIKLLNSNDKVYGDLVGFLESNYHNTIKCVVDILFDKNNLKWSEFKNRKLYENISEKLPDIYLSYSNMLNDSIYKKGYNDPDLYVKPESCIEGKLSENEDTLAQNPFSDILMIKLFKTLKYNTIADKNSRKEIQINNEIQKRRDDIFGMQAKLTLFKRIIDSISLKTKEDSSAIQMSFRNNCNNICYSIPINENIEKDILDIKREEYHYIPNPEDYAILNTLKVDNNSLDSFYKDQHGFQFKNQIPKSNIVSDEISYTLEEGKRVLVPQSLLSSFLMDTRKFYKNKEISISSECSTVDMRNEDSPRIYYVELN